MKRDGGRYRDEPGGLHTGAGEAFAGLVVQRKASASAADAATPAVAAEGVASAGSPLPYLDTAILRRRVPSSGA